MATELHAPPFRLLGDLELAGVHAGALRGLKLRTLLAYLLLHAGEIVATDRLVDAVWGDHAPPTATAIVHGYIRKLRVTLADAPVELLTRAPGYVLELAEGELDIRAFERLAKEGKDELRAGRRPEEARAKLAEAESLWRGEPLADLPAEGFVATERARLAQVHLAVIADRVEADLTLGRTTEVIPDLEALVREDPFQEWARRQLMLALYRSGRQAEALELYRQTRRLFNDELGIEPSTELRRLEQAILRQEPDLDALPLVRDGEDGGRGSLWRPQLTRRRGAAVAALGVLLIGGATAAVVAGTRDVSAPGVALRPQAPALIAKIPVPLPACCGFGFGSVWAAGHHDRTLRRIDPRSNTVVGRIPGVGYQASAVLAAAGSVWVASRDGLLRIDPQTHRIIARLDTPGGALAFGFLDVWQSTLDNRLVRVDLASNKVVADIRLDSGVIDWGNELAIGFGSVWVARADEHALLRIDPASNQVVARIRGFGSSYSGMPIAIGEGAVWAFRFAGDRMALFRVDPSTNRVVARIPIGTRGATPPAGTVTVGAGSVWTGNWDSTLSRIDPRSNKVIAVYTLPSIPQNVTFGEGSLWVDSYDASRIWRIEPEF